MRIQCSVCRHVRCGEIEAALANKEPLRVVARTFGVSKDAARRHGKHMVPKPDPLTVEIPPCPVHGPAPFRFDGREWLCGECHLWDGKLAYWKSATATVAREDGANSGT